MLWTGGTLSPSGFKNAMIRPDIDGLALPEAQICEASLLAETPDKTPFLQLAYYGTKQIGDPKGGVTLSIKRNDPLRLQILANGDIVANDQVWRGLRAPLTTQGRLGGLEKSIWQLNQWWLDQMLD